MTNFFTLFFDALRGAVLISGLVVVMMMIIESFNVESDGRMFRSLRKSGFAQVLVSSLLGTIPGCVGGFAAVSLYTHRMLSFGALVAMMIATVGDESGSATRMDFLPALGPGIEESLAGMEIAELLQSKIRDILPSLSEKEAYILEHRLLTDDPATLREIGERYNVTRERVRQLEARLLQKLKTHLSTDIQDFSEDWISH